MEHAYSLHGHTRSMSSLASTIIPLPSEPSPMTPVPLSSMELEQPPDLPNEFKIPLPPSRASSECGDGEEQGEKTEISGPVVPEIATHEQTPPVYPHRSDEESIGMDAQSSPHTETASAPAVSLDDLGRLFALEYYGSQYAKSVQSRLDELSRSSAISRRLIHSSSLAYGNLIDHYRNTDHGGFAALYQTCEELVDECIHGGLSPQSQNLHGPENELNLEDLDGQSNSWMQRLPVANQEDILEFLSKIRTDKLFLSDCISRLSPQELNAFASSHQFTGSSDSVFQNYIRSQARSHGKDRSGGRLAPSMDTLRAFYRKDALFASLHGVFDDSAKQGSQEYLLRADVWSRTCARLLTECKQGSEDFVITMLDAFSTFQEWKLKPKMEIYFMKLLNEGAFLLDPPQTPDFKQPVEIRNAQAVVAISNFFDKALQELFQLLVDDNPQIGVPDSALDFAHAILNKIQDPRIQTRAKTLITSRWYFSSFISNAIVYPESHGIMMTHHIGDTARQKILKELSTRMQRQVADVTAPWNHMTIVTPDTQARVEYFLALFQPRLPEKLAPPVRPLGETVRPGCLMLSAQTIICLTNLFYPDLPSPSTDFSYCINPSTASSFAGSSTLTCGSAERGSTTASSLAPSISGTFATTSTVVSESSLEDIQAKDKQSHLSPLEELCLKQTAGPNLSLGCQLKLICKKLEETLTSENDPVQNHFAKEWAFIYITQNGKKLHASLRNTGPNLSKPTSPNYQTPDLDGIHRPDLEELQVALSTLNAGGDNFGQLMNDIRSRVEKPHDIGSVLRIMFESVMSDCHACFDFTNAFFWWRNVRLLERISSIRDKPNYLDILLGAIAKELEFGIDALSRSTERNQAWFRSLANLQRFQEEELNGLENRRRALRIKMWYVSDVRHSAPYEDALYVTRALRAMVTSSRMKQPGSISNWARQRLRNSIWQDRSEAQTLEALAAHKDHGGFSKLADEQVELTTRWLTRNSVENFCKGEERIHRFCFEIQKCVNKLAGLNLLDSPVLWSSRLFGREKLAFDARLPMSRNYESLHKSSTTHTPASSHSGGLMSSKPSYSAINPSSDSHSFRPSNDTSHFNRIWNLPSSYEFNARTPPLESQFNHYSGIVSSRLTSILPQSMSSPGHSNFSRSLPEEVMNSKKSFIHQIKKILYSLMISDLGYLLWTQGSETDAWISLRKLEDSSTPRAPIFAGTNGYHKSKDPEDSVRVFHVFDNSTSTLEHQKVGTKFEISSPRDEILQMEDLVNNIRARPAGSWSRMNGKSVQNKVSPFPYKKALKSLLDRFSFNPDPYVKLQILSELELLVLSYREDITNTGSATEAHGANGYPYPVGGTHFVKNRHLSVPRTKATSLEEVIANCTERRAGTLHLVMRKGISMGISQSDKSSPEVFGPDSIINALLAIFHDPTLRPPTLYRDLQFIAAFIPPSILDQTPQGKSFWDTGLAALALKEDLCASTITRATKITNYHISSIKPPIQTYDPSLASTTLRDAAKLWLITAKEGSPIAARELGLFYLTHPELLPRVTSPFSKAKDVFRSIIPGDHPKGGGGGGSGLGGVVAEAGASAPRGLDPWTFAVVFHWMELAANGGDRDARDFLRGNGELSRAR